MIRTIIKQIPISDIGRDFTTEEKIRAMTYTKPEVDAMIAEAIQDAIDEARKIDEASMLKHNRDATVISMILGFTTLALFVDGLLRLLGIIPPFMDVDVNILERIVERVESDITPILQRIPKI